MVATEGAKPPKIFQHVHIEKKRPQEVKMALALLLDLQPKVPPRVLSFFARILRSWLIGAVADRVAVFIEKVGYARGEDQASWISDFRELCKK